MSRVVGVCSWSLRAESPGELVTRIQAVGVSAVQLALEPLRAGAWALVETRERLAAAGIEIRSAMMQTAGEDYSTLETIRATGGLRPDERWPQNRAVAVECAALARLLGVRLVTFHAGFLPHDRRDPERAKLILRLREVVDLFARQEVEIALETGQEEAATLVAVLDELERPAAGVNFDPANMILYAMGDPIAALRKLAPRVRQVHVKDARRTTTPNQWGQEVPAGTGDVDWARFFAAMDETGLRSDLMIEREAGDDRVGDIRAARRLVEEYDS